MSPHTVTGHFTGCTFHSSTRIVRAWSQRFFTSTSDNGLHSHSCSICLSTSAYDGIAPNPSSGLSSCPIPSCCVLLPRPSSFQPDPRRSVRPAACPSSLSSLSLPNPLANPRSLTPLLQNLSDPMDSPMHHQHTQTILTRSLHSQFTRNPLTEFQLQHRKLKPRLQTAISSSVLEMG